MRKTACLLLLVSCSSQLFSQQLTLDDCLNKAIHHYPLLKQKQYLDDAYQLKQKNIGANWLPSLDAGAKATYQSDVVEISGDLPFPADFPSPSKDQYAVTVDINQTIYDGGINRKHRNLEQWQTQADQKQVDIELHKLKEQVLHVFFSIHLLHEHLDLANIMHQELENRIKTATSSVEHGVLLKSELQNLKAEEISVRQNIASLNADISSAYNILSTYIGEDINDAIPLVKPEIVDVDTLDVNRPEKLLFDINQSALTANQQLLKAQRNPKLMAYSQLGYGRPGLNLISDDFDSYFLVGARLSWNIFDWNQNKRERQILEINKNVVNASEQTFDQNLAITLQKQQADIGKLETLLEMDNEIVALHQEVVQTAASQLDNGVITSVDYLTKLNEANRAKINMAVHSVQLLQTKAMYKLLVGH